MVREESLNGFSFAMVMSHLPNHLSVFCFLFFQRSEGEVVILGNPLAGGSKRAHVAKSQST